MENISAIGQRCFGCKSCEQSCPRHCITMEENAEGFWYPAVDEKSCVDCGKCLKACPAADPSVHRSQPRSVWAWRNRSDADLMRSASGGAADSAARAVLEMGGRVFGAAYDENLTVGHIELKSDSEREKIQSSKYVQSDPGDSYSRVKARLLAGKSVLFTGTPCQIAGLYAFLGGDAPGLYTVDLICHGVPSPKLFQKYIEYWSRRDGRVISFNFRAKAGRGWGTQYQIKTKTRIRTGTLALDRYGKHFMDGDCYRQCCYQCPYANTQRTGDLTVGDFWGIGKSHPDFDSPKGVSSVFVNTPKGEELLEKMRPFGLAEPASLEQAMVKQGNLVKPTVRPEARNTFYREIDRPGYIESLRVGLQMKERVKAALPAGMVRWLKKRLG